MTTHTVVEVRLDGSLVSACGRFVTEVQQGYANPSCKSCRGRNESILDRIGV